MLSFNTNMTNRFDRDSNQSFWYLKLYYGNETNFTGVSDRDRTISSVHYHGIVQDWGKLNFTLSVDNFTASQRTWNVKMVNTEKSCDVQRFSDLLSSNNYENRKWELYVNDDTLSDSDTEMIATGIISGDFSYNDKSMTLRLQAKSSKMNAEVPNTGITQGAFQNAPEKNRGIAIPCLYGDFSIDSSLPSPLDQYVSQVKVPAIVVDEFNQSDSKVELRPDSVALLTLYAKNLYHYNDGIYSACESSNVSVTSGTTVVKFSGRTFFAYKPLTGQQAAVDRDP